ncbi:MAG: hypothetical protein VE96_C0004G0011 [candidate division Kazan bacterium GW2011_GWA1_44_22]|uniref:Uncharacterized protein n=1 Tax=candidate division Kazan bacterium GW2011_GWA1_44_22 TaxID=1620410 RepID=A0A0G1KYL1_UNCK3|nr:MAG: hypothetical protein VE96_C0004G0011 [candidate division Kazan bacterium GW2011_GWA1_44_22]
MKVFILPVISDFRPTLSNILLVILACPGSYGLIIIRFWSQPIFIGLPRMTDLWAAYC